MELLIFITCSFLLSKQYYYLLLTFFTSKIIFDWAIENDDNIFEDKLALTIKNTCLTINKYNNKFSKVSIYNYLNNKFLVIVSIIKKSLTNKFEKLYVSYVVKNVENNYDKLLMSCFGSMSSFIEPSNNYKYKNKEKEKEKQKNNVDDDIKKYISTLKKSL
jgi:hypothetical protein